MGDLRTGMMKANHAAFVSSTASSSSFFVYPNLPLMQYKCDDVAGDRSNQCPQGFTLVSAGPYCAGKSKTVKDQLLHRQRAIGMFKRLNIVFVSRTFSLHA